MGKIKDLTGQKFGRLTVLYRGENNKHHKAQWWCKCDCGNPELVLVIGCHLTNGNTKSCGCYSSESRKDCSNKHTINNNFNLLGEYGIGWTSNTNEEFYFDLEDFDKIKNYCWYASISTKNGYRSIRARDRVTKKIVPIHEVIIGKKHQDHIDRNTFNNRKSNLRDCTQFENTKNKSLQKNNTSGVAGVCFNKNVQKWVARVNIDCVQTDLGYFESFEDAVVARLKAEKEYYGEFAPQKHLYEQYNI